MVRRDQGEKSTQAGFVLLELYEDDWSDEVTPLNAYMPTYIATLGRRL